MTETAVSFECEGAALVGILHSPEAREVTTQDSRSDKPGSQKRRGVLIVVGGGPQYRAGGHRQLTLWSRFLCSNGYPVFRFDYRGMGDSHGAFRGFEDADADIRSAVDQFFALVPDLDEVVLWGECDAASAILFYAYRDARVKGCVLLNPWVRTQAGEAKAILRFYYLNRLTEPSFWRKVLSMRFNPVKSVASAIKVVRQSRAAGSTGTQAAGQQGLEAPIPRDLPLPDRLLMGLQRFNGPVMMVLSGRDLIAREFGALADGSPLWQEEFRRKPVLRHELAEGDHTFSSNVLRSQVVSWGLHWIRSW